jgi:hypothetical protein
MALDRTEMTVGASIVCGGGENTTFALFTGAFYSGTVNHSENKMGQLVVKAIVQTMVCESCKGLRTSQDKEHHCYRRKGRWPVTAQVIIFKPSSVTVGQEASAFDHPPPGLNRAKVLLN